MQKLLIFLLITSISFAQNAERKYLSHKWENGYTKIKVSDGEYFIKIINDKILETSFVPLGENLIKKSDLTIDVKTPNFDIVTGENIDNITITAKNLSAKIIFSPFQIEYSYNRKLLFSEKTGYPKINDSTEILDFNISADEKLYGGGARVLGMNRRGNRLRLYNRAQYGYETRAELMNFCIPLVLSSKIYAVHFDNAAIGYLDLDSKKDNTLQYETISGRKTYQVIAGDSWEDLITSYTTLTGKQPLPPRWAFGNFSSRFGYHSQEEVEKTIQKFQDEKIPVDAIILDLYWFGKDIKGTMGNLDWDKDNFPNPEKMISNLNAKGVKTILITEPFVLTTSSKWNEAVAEKILATDKKGDPFTYDFYFGNTGIIDIFKPEGKNWFWNIYKKLINQGVAGLWGDLGEPEVFPSKALTARGTADEVHNIYGHNWAKLVADGYKNDFPNVRPFILMRSGYSGSQRYGMIPWSGDVNRTWGGFSGQTEIALQMGMQGMAYMHSDLGGFAGANLDDELYVRWLQYGVFNPIFRPHAQEEVASEPIFRSEKAKKLVKQAIELRYKLLPYNYNIAFENSQTGKPLMRPLFFEEPQNEMLLSKSDEYLWGNDFLIAPITEKGQTKKQVYFPKSSNWFDFYSDKKYEAGSTNTIDLFENNIPTFIRGGSFIPMAKPMQNTQNYNLNDFDVHFYLDKTVKISNLNLYNDDGNTPNNFENQRYEKYDFRSKFDNNSLQLKVQYDKANSELNNSKKINLVLHGFTKAPKSISVNDKKLKKSKWKFNNNLIELSLNCKLDQTQKIEIKL